jgi:hypothetical protein
MQTEPEHSVFRIVIGCYQHAERHWSARNELLANGLRDDQVCSLGSLSVLKQDNCDPAAAGLSYPQPDNGIRYETRKVEELDVRVSCPSLFDRLLSRAQETGQSLAAWLTPAQSGAIRSKLLEDCVLLLVSTETPQQQVTSSQIQLRHGPMVVQAFNFAG